MRAVHYSHRPEFDVLIMYLPFVSLRDKLRCLADDRKEILMETLNIGPAQTDGFLCWLGCTANCTVACLADLVSPIMDIVSYSAFASTFFVF